MILKKENLIPILFFSFYCVSGLISNYGAMDRVVTQWVYLSIINLLGLLYLFNDFKHLKSSISNSLRSKPFLFLSAFVVWGLLSYFYALNQVEVLVKFFRWINIAIALLICTTLVSHFKNSLSIISIIFSIVLITELYFSYNTYFQIIRLTDYDFNLANFIRGSSANKNITAASLLIKMPFVFYIIGKFKNSFIQFFGLLIVGFTTFLIFLLSARAAIISLTLIIASMIIFKAIQYYKTKQIKIVKNTILLFIPILFSFVVFQTQYGSQNSASLINRVSDISKDDKSTQQRLRFYSHSLYQIKDNPFIGVGLGNWKIKSIDYDKKHIEGYIVPYHTHNDFLELGAELGIIGIILYLGIFIYIIKFVLIDLKHKVYKMNVAPEALILLFGGLVYFVDANLNFPHARVVMQIPFILYVAISIQLIKKIKSGKQDK